MKTAIRITTNTALMYVVMKLLFDLEALTTYELTVVSCLIYICIDQTMKDLFK